MADRHSLDDQRDEAGQVAPLGMPALLTTEQLAFLRQRHIAVLAMVDGFGEPHAVPTWYAVDGPKIVMVTGRGSRKHRNLERKPKATVVIVHRSPPYYALMIGCAADISGNGVALIRSKIAARYLGEPELSTYLESRRERDSVVIRLEPLSVAVYGETPPPAGAPTQ